MRTSGVEAAAAGRTVPPTRAWEVLMESRLYGPGLHQSFPVTGGAWSATLDI